MTIFLGETKTKVTAKKVKTYAAKGNKRLVHGYAVTTKKRAKGGLLGEFGF